MSHGDGVVGPQHDVAPPPSDEQLVQRAQQGDSSACRELVDRHARSLFGMAYSMLNSAADAEDMVQEALLGALKRLHAFEGRSTFRTWLTRILLNHISKFHRSRRTRATTSLSAQPEGQTPFEPVARSAGSLGAPVAQITHRLDVAAMLQTLSPEHRQVIVLRELQGMSYSEIAELLNVPQGTVESRLYRARNDLRARFKSYFA